MSVLTYPTLSRPPNRSVYAYDGNSTLHTSWLTAFTITTNFGGEKWDAALFYDHLENDDRAALIGFLARLNGQENRVSLPVFGKQQRGNFGGTPLVQGADQVGKVLLIDGATASVTDWIRDGDYFSVNGELKIATADANSDAGGNVTLEFEPRLRNSPPDDAAIETTDPTGTFILADSRSEWTYRPGGFSDFSLAFVEALT